MAVEQCGESYSGAVAKSIYLEVEWEHVGVCFHDVSGGRAKATCHDEQRLPLNPRQSADVPYRPV